MLKNVLFRAFLGAAALSVLAIAPTEAFAQRTRPASADADNDKEKAKAKAKAKAQAKAKATAAAQNQQVKAKAAKAKAAAAASAEEIEAAKTAAAEAHAQKLGKIERLEQIATATSNDELKSQVQKLKELEDKRHNLATSKIAAEGGA